MIEVDIMEDVPEITKTPWFVVRHDHTPDSNLRPPYPAFVTLVDARKFCDEKGYKVIRVINFQP